MLSDSRKQQLMLDGATAHAASRDMLFSDMVKAGLKRLELEQLIAKRPTLWRRYAVWLPKLPQREE